MVVLVVVPDHIRILRGHRNWTFEFAGEVALCTALGIAELPCDEWVVISDCNVR